jgi:hypothetical protein
MASSTRPRKLAQYQAKRDFTRTPEPSGQTTRRKILHKADDAALPGWDPEQHPASVKTGRTNDEVAG